MVVLIDKSGHSLLSLPYKVFCKILTNTITRELDNQQLSDQTGFRNYYRMLNHLKIINKILRMKNVIMGMENSLFGICLF